MIAKKINFLEIGKKFSIEYNSQLPYPHIVLDNLFSKKVLEEVCEEFHIHTKEKVIFNNPNEKKITLNKWDEFGSSTLKFLKFLNGKTFVTFLEHLTKINNLVPDNYLEGGGLHQVNKGGLLKIHADFNKHSVTNLDRRLNVLIYLNKNWKNEWGGEFELWSQELKGCEKKVLPVFNRMVIFSTTSHSYHGHPSPLNCPNNVSRKSIAMYYYTDGRPPEEVTDGLKYHSTLFKVRPESKEDRTMLLYNLLKKLKPKSFAKSILPKRVLDKYLDKKRK